MSERTLTCRDCGQEFVFTTGEQEFYQQRGFSDPQRCPTCRQSRKAQRTQSGGGGYSSGGGSSSGGGYSSGGSGYSSGGGGYSSGGYGNDSGNSGGYSSGGNDRGGYSSGGNDRGGYSSGGNDRGGYSSAPRQLYPATCSECGQQTEVPFNPTPGKPVFCRDCFQAKKTTTSYDRW